MKNILVIEDDSFKADSLVEHIETTLHDAKTSIATNLVDAVQLVNSNVYDLIVIDMAIPSHPTVLGGGSPMSLLTGGLDILLELIELERKDPCIIITQFTDIELSGDLYPVNEAKHEIKNQLGCEVLTCIEYSEGSANWKTALNEVLNSI